MVDGARQPIEVFFSYSRKDKELRDELDTHLALLKRRGVTTWHDCQIVAGSEWEEEINRRIKTADIVLLLISSDFIASNYCYEKELPDILQRHEAREAYVIPVLLRSVSSGWKQLPFAKLQICPSGGLPVTQWKDRDAAFADVAESIEEAVNKLLEKRDQERQEQAKARWRQEEEQQQEAEIVKAGKLGEPAYPAETSLSGGSQRVGQKEEIVLPPLQIPSPKKNQKEEQRLSSPRKKLTSSDFAEVLKESETAYSRKTGKSLSDIQRSILQGAWQGWTYERIASFNKTSTVRIEQSASRLWEILSDVLKEKVTKTTFRSTMKRKLQESSSPRLVREPRPSQSIQPWKQVSSFFAHKGWVNAIAINRDSRTLVTGGQDCSVKAWSLQTGECIRIFGGILWDKPHTKPVQGVMVSPNCDFLVSASEDWTVKVWNLSNGKQRCKPLEHRSSVHSVAISPDSQIIASGCSDQTVKIWRVSDGQCCRTFGRHSGSINSLGFSPDGKWLVSASEDKTVKIWDLPTGQLSTSLPEYTSSAKYTVFSADGRFLAIIYADRTIKILDFHRGEELYEISGEAVSIASDSKILACALDKEIKIWNLLSGELISSFKGGAGFIRCLSFSPRNQHHYTLVSSHDEIIKVWQVEYSKVLPTK
jgi:WD40 repeat protein